MKFVVVLLSLYCFHQASGVTHTLQYFYTATSGIPNFPEFISLGVVDGQQIDYYDSFKKTVEPKAKWMSAAVDSDYWSTQTQASAGDEQTFKNNINVAKSRFNQSEGIHTVQYMYGCEWDDESQHKNGFRQYGYDGKDWLVYDMDTYRWIASVQQAEITQRKWNDNRAELEMRKHYITNQCIEWLQKYVQYGKSAFQSKISPPQGSLIHQDLSSEVTCIVTGFYPEGVMITLKRDEKEVQDDMTVGDLLPNDDGTFQRRASLKVSPDEMKNSKFTCEVSHKTGNLLFTMKEKESSSIGIIVGCVIATLVVVMGVIGAIFMMKKNGYKKTSQYETGSNGSSNNSNLARTTE